MAPADIPTQIGDVLILAIETGLKVVAVGVVTREGQQDFHFAANVHYELTQAAALAVAKRLVQPGRRIFIRHLWIGSLDWDVVDPAQE